MRRSFLVVVIGCAAAVGCGKKPPRATAPDPAAPAAAPEPTEWTKVDTPDGMFTVYFPPGAKPSPGTMPQVTPPAHDRMPTMKTWFYSLGDRSFSAIAMYWPANTASSAEPKTSASLNGIRDFEAQTTLSGRLAKMTRDQPYTVNPKEQRTHLTVSAGLGNARSVSFSVVSKTPYTFDDPLVKEYFARVVIHDPPAAKK